MKLPVFKVSTTVAPAERIGELGRRIFPRQDHQIIERGTAIELRSALGSVEVDIGRGGVWAGNAAKLWRPDPAAGRKRNLLSAGDAEKLGMQMLKSHGILPELAAPFRLKPIKAAGTITAFAPERGGAHQVIQEDSTIMAGIEVEIGEYGPATNKTLPLVGGGGRFSAVFGEGGQPLAVRGVWRPTVDKPSLHEVIAQARTDESYRAMMDKVPLKEFSAELAYYSAPAFSGQDLLYPVYVYSGVADYQGNRVPLRKVMLPATEIGPITLPPPPQPPRRPDAAPTIRPLPADFQLHPGHPLPPGIAVNRRLLRNKGFKLDELFVPGPAGSPLIVKPDLDLLKIKELSNLLGFYSAGTSWIGLSGGLAGSQNNAKGFVDELAAIGWNIRFNWGDGNAFESDWRKNDDTWVDAVDFVFYTGHANSDGWVLAAPDDTFLHFAETAGAADLWGANNLEWAAIAACGPLQDDLVGSGGNVLDRWRDAFDGLHLLMGYAQVTYDNEEEGKRLAKYAKAGSTLMQAWFRTGQEIQPGGIWSGAYYVGNGSGSTGSDHLWGVGAVGPDIASPTWRACTWVPC